jgi:hypothetical protein
MCDDGTCGISTIKILLNLVSDVKKDALYDLRAADTGYLQAADVGDVTKRRNSINEGMYSNSASLVLFVVLNLNLHI